MNKVIVYFLAPLITLVLAYLKFAPWWTDDFKTRHPVVSNFIEYSVLAGTAFIYYFSILSPHRKYEKAVKSKWDAMEKLSKRLDEDYQGVYKFGINVMLTRIAFFYSIEPKPGAPDKQKFSLYGRIFRVARELVGDPIHEKFKLTINQGVCGSVYREGKETSKDYIKGSILLPELVGEKNFNFSTKQKEYTKDLILVVSCPLILNKKEGDSFKRKKIGVLNVESRVFDSVDLLLDPAKQDKFYEKVANLAYLFITLHV